VSVIAEFSIAAGDFVLGKALRGSSGLTADVETMVPVDSGTIPYFWVDGENLEAFEGALGAEADIATFEAVDEVDGRTLYRVEWGRSGDAFVDAVADHDVVLLEASGDAERWLFRLRFPDAHALSAFHTRCREDGIDVTVERMFNPIEPTMTDANPMTDSQRNLIQRAHEEGYFEVPRKITLAELAEQLDVSDQAVNERLRRGLSALLDAGVVFDPDERSDDLAGDT